MRIKEVESRVGIPSKNIRYYEEVGLISPKRNDENNYRDYSEEDIILLEQIKMLRMLGFSIASIKEIEEGKTSLSEAAESLLEEFESQQKKLTENIEICKTIIRDRCSVDELDEHVFDCTKPVWQERLRLILAEDITKEIVSEKKLKQFYAGILSYGFVLGFIISLIFGNFFLSGGDNTLMTTHTMGVQIWVSVPGFLTNNYIMISVVVMIAGYILQYLTSNMVALTVLFHVLAVMNPPFLATVAREFVRLPGTPWENQEMIFNSSSFALNWLFLIGFLWLLFAAGNHQSKVNGKKVAVLAIGYTALMTVGFGLLFGTWISTFVFFALFTLYLSTGWCDLAIDLKGRSKYYAIVRGMSVMNFVGTGFAMFGKSKLHITPANENKNQ